MHGDLSILKAVTKTTYPSTPSVESDSPPSPVAPVDPLDLSFAYISSKSIDLSIVKKEQEEEKRKQHLTTEEPETPSTLMDDSQKQQNEATIYRHVGIGITLLILFMIGLWMNDNRWIRQDGFSITQWHRLDFMKSLSEQTRQWLYDCYYSLHDAMEAVMHSMIVTIDQHFFLGNLAWVLTGNHQ